MRYRRSRDDEAGTNRALLKMLQALGFHLGATWRVVTQRSAKPFTPVQFRAWPPTVGTACRQPSPPGSSALVRAQAERRLRPAVDIAAAISGIMPEIEAAWCCRRIAHRRRWNAGKTNKWCSHGTSGHGRGDGRISTSAPAARRRSKCQPPPLRLWPLIYIPLVPFGLASLRLNTAPSGRPRTQPRFRTARPPVGPSARPPGNFSWYSRARARNALEPWPGLRHRDRPRRRKGRRRSSRAPAIWHPR